MSNLLFISPGIGVKEFWMGICQNCTALSIETSPTKTSTPYHRSLKYWSVFVKFFAICELLTATAFCHNVNRRYPVPYPSSFHWWDGITTLPWLARSSGGLGGGSGSSSGSIERRKDRNRRDILALFIGKKKWAIRYLFYYIPRGVVSWLKSTSVDSAIWCYTLNKSPFNDMLGTTIFSWHIADCFLQARRKRRTWTRTCCGASCKRSALLRWAPPASGTLLRTPAMASSMPQIRCVCFAELSSVWLRLGTA